MPSRLPSTLMNISRTTAETKTSNPKNALILLAKSCRMRSPTFGPCSMIYGMNCE
jgi:hypothetical protein